jgi:hypothetical protein
MSSYFDHICESNRLADIVDIYHTRPVTQGAARTPIYIDRHVVGYDLAPRAQGMSDPTFRQEAITAAVCLARCWHAEALHFGSTPISSPFVIVDDEWVTGELDDPPPHVLICVGQASFDYDFGRPLTDDEFIRSPLSFLDRLGLGIGTVSRTEAGDIAGNESGYGRYEIRLRTCPKEGRF